MSYTVETLPIGYTQPALDIESLPGFRGYHATVGGSPLRVEEDKDVS